MLYINGDHLAKRAITVILHRNIFTVHVFADFYNLQRGILLKCEKSRSVIIANKHIQVRNVAADDLTRGHQGDQ